jgi:hypothetical protein
MVRVCAFVHFCFVFLFTIGVVSACTCIPQGVKQDAANASMIFRGVVMKVEELPERKETRRMRYAVTFSVARYWKGERQLGS